MDDTGGIPVRFSLQPASSGWLMLGMFGVYIPRIPATDNELEIALILSVVLAQIVAIVLYLLQRHNAWISTLILSLPPLFFVTFYVPLFVDNVGTALILAGASLSLIGIVMSWLKAEVVLENEHLVLRAGLKQRTIHYHDVLEVSKNSFGLPVLSAILEPTVRLTLASASVAPGYPFNGRASRRVELPFRRACLNNGLLALRRKLAIDRVS